MTTREQASDMLICLQIDIEPFKLDTNITSSQTTLMNSFLYIQGPLQMNMGFPTKKARVPGLINCKVDIKLQNPLSLLTIYFGH